MSEQLNSVSYFEQVKNDKLKLKKAGIKSPNHTKMYRIRRPDGYYYYKNKKKYETALEHFRKLDEQHEAEEARKEERLRKIREKAAKQRKKPISKNEPIHDKRCILF